MKPTVVVDVGNTRIKWGLCGYSEIREAAPVPPDDPAAWQQQVQAWQEFWHLPGPFTWAISGVHPQRSERFIEWLRQRGEEFVVLRSASQLPLTVRVPNPEAVGIDRLLNAVAARNIERKPVPIIIVDAGSAITVDLLDSAGAFRGGAIFPGLRLMAQALHDHTALLPLVEDIREAGTMPGTSTTEAIKAGVYCAALGGIKLLIRRLAKRAHSLGDPSTNGPSLDEPEIFVTGGDAFCLGDRMPGYVRISIHLTLDGIRLAAQAQP